MCMNSAPSLIIVCNTDFLLDQESLLLKETELVSDIFPPLNSIFFPRSHRRKQREIVVSLR